MIVVSGVLVDGPKYVYLCLICSDLFAKEDLIRSVGMTYVAIYVNESESEREKRADIIGPHTILQY